MMTTSQPNQLLVTAKELSERYGIAQKTVRRKAREGIFPFVRLGRRCVRYPVAKCDAIMGRLEVPALDS
jgi:predicted DNA-binding transcriptional regulator AlpA